jgi:transposase
MVVASGTGIPIGALVENANIFESKLTEQVVDTIRVPRAARGRPRTHPKRLIADRAYDSAALREKLRRRGIDFITPDRPERTVKVQDGRKLRRYRRRWKIERVFSWLDSWKRIAMRWDRSLTTYSGLFHLAIMIIALRRL